MTFVDSCRRAAIGATVLCAGAGSAVMASASEGAANTIPLAAHEAVYDLSLAHSDKLSLEAIRGRIVYEFTGSPCAGYTTQVRQVTSMDNGEGGSNLNDLQSKTWEDEQGNTFRFKSSNFIDENRVMTVDGEAKRDAKGIKVVLKQPKAKSFRLDARTVFPTEQLRRVIAAARTGQTIVSLPVYDGSENGEKVYNTLAVIGKLIPPSVKLDDASADKPALAKMPRWHVRVSYFDQHGNGEQTPAYSIAFEVFENGISRALTLDYNDFAISGRLSKLELKAPQACK